MYRNYFWAPKYLNSVSSSRFLREDDEKADSETWDEKMAAKYYASLYREFAVCDLKHYKSGEVCMFGLGLFILWLDGGSDSVRLPCLSFPVRPSLEDGE